MQPAIGSAFSGIQSAYGSMASGVVLTLRNLFADPTVKIAGRDGTLTYSGGVTSGAGHTGTISPYDGSLVASGDPVMSYLGIPGVGRIPLVHAQGAATNLVPNSSDGSDIVAGAASPSAITKTDMGGGVTRITKTGTGGGVVLYTPIDFGGIIGDSLTVTTRTEFRYISGNVSGLAFGIRQNGSPFSTVDTPITSFAGYDSGEWVTLHHTGTLATAGDTQLRTVHFSGLAATECVFELRRTQAEVAPLPSMHLPTAGAPVSRTADVFTWSDFGGTSTVSGETMAFSVPYLWSAGAGVAPPPSVAPRLWEAEGVVGLAVRTVDEDFFRKADGSGNRTASVTSLADASGVVRVQSHAYNETGVRLYRGGVLAAEQVTVASSWTAINSMRVACAPFANREYAGGVAIIHRNGGFTQAERDAVQQLMQKTVAFVA